MLVIDIVGKSRVYSVLLLLVLFVNQRNTRKYIFHGPFAYWNLWVVYAIINTIVQGMNFKISKKLNTQCLAYDFVFDDKKRALLIEISYGFLYSGYDDCKGYWDESLHWHPGKINPQGWMIKNVLKN